MRSKIRVLSDAEINQIAAGEVIEDPASVVKEVVENAIDAGASKISVEIAGGGLNQIIVKDNGSGMMKDDATLAFERHATSKIRKASDILGVRSMGFRGEALASIASIAKVELVTAAEEGMGTKVICHGGKLIDSRSHAHPIGTSVTITSLFYNTPARKKFQKSAQQLTKNVVKMMTKLSLAHPKIMLTLTSQGKTLLKTSQREVKRITEVLGEDFEKQCKEVSYEKDGFKVSGIVGTPENVRSNRLGQYLFVNNRSIYSLVASNAVQSAFNTMISKGEHPTFLLWCEFPTEEIDINVHPQKKEVRFSNEEKVFSIIRAAVEKALSGFEMPSYNFAPPQVREKNYAFREPKFEAREPISFKPTPEPVLFEQETLINVIGISKHLLFCHLLPGHPLFPAKIGDEELLVIADLSKVEALLTVNRLTKQLNEGSEKQARLLPETLEYPVDDTALITKHLKQLDTLGIALQPFGKGTFLLDAISQDLDDKEIKELILQIVVQLDQGLSTEAIAKSIVAKRTLRRNYSIEEGKRLLKQLSKLENPYRSPSGDATIVGFTGESMDGLFKGKSVWI